MMKQKRHGQNKTESAVRTFLENQGFSVSRIKKSETMKRADFVVEDDRHSYIVEVKGRDENSDYEESIASEGIGERLDYMGRTNAMSALVEEAAAQLRSTL
jgi:Holliday junction resolvase